MTAAAGRGLDALAKQVDDLRWQVEGLRGTVDADIDALGSLLDETDRGDGPAGAIPALRYDVAGLHSNLVALAEQIAALTDGPDAQPRLPSWTEMDAVRAGQAWNALVRWMQRVLFARYPPATEVIRDCWYRHPELVEHLSWLQVSWVVAYHNPSSSISTAAEWHSRWLPVVLDRARQILKPCYLHHLDDSRVPPERHQGFNADLDAFIRADVVRRPQPAEDPNATDRVRRHA